MKLTEIAQVLNFELPQVQEIANALFDKVSDKTDLNDAQTQLIEVVIGRMMSDRIADPIQAVEMVKAEIQQKHQAEQAAEIEALELSEIEESERVDRQGVYQAADVAGAMLFADFHIRKMDTFANAVLYGVDPSSLPAETREAMESANQRAMEAIQGTQQKLSRLSLQVAQGKRPQLAASRPTKRMPLMLNASAQK